jgi:hypothetical protein
MSSLPGKIPSCCNIVVPMMYHYLRSDQYIITLSASTNPCQHQYLHDHAPPLVQPLYFQLVARLIRMLLSRDEFGHHFLLMTTLSCN